MNGAWVFVCGPSGAGKDSVIASANQILGEQPDVVFARRIVTRAPHAGSDHDPVTEADFDALVRSDSLSWHWQAHGFFYGIARRYADAVLEGRTVVINGSRAHVAGLPLSSARRLVTVTASTAHLTERLLRRGRESDNAITERMARNNHFMDLAADHQVVNDTELLAAGRQLADYLISLGR